MKTPKQVRADIKNLMGKLNQVHKALLDRSSITVAQIGKECLRTADALGELLKKNQLPDDYKVAVVGRFKAGKSSFVNELLGARLASEDTNPETAAITSFRHGSQVKATIRFVPHQEWMKLQTLYADDPKHDDAHRVKIWNTFAKPKKPKDREVSESFDLVALEKKYIRPDGHKIEIHLGTDGTKKTEAEFRRQLKEYTSGSMPLHCLVQGIEITSPAELLEEGVLLIDTPGLDDTERFRVSLTEKAVEDVDAVLFLTKSGAAYGQSEKDFLLTLLRKGTIKQLIIVITQVDQTYAQHVRAAEDGDEAPDSLANRIELERLRINAEVNSTLNNLGQDDSPAMRRYREQLGAIEIAFTSAVLHRDWRAKKPISYSMAQDDPGGVERLKSQLMQMLSTESRLALLAHNISNGARANLIDLQTVLDTKLSAIRDIKDKEVAEQKLRTFREEFGAAITKFEDSVKELVGLLSERLEQRRQQHDLLIENIVLSAEQELAVFELRDVARHWRSRRSGYWGYMHDFQARVANRIFPKVQGMLTDYTELFASYAGDFEIYLGALSQQSSTISESLELGAVMPFELAIKLRESLNRTLNRAQELISVEEVGVTTLLDDFVSDDVSERISKRRQKVSGIWGTGTTSGQSAEVRKFYQDVRGLLSEALTEHLQSLAGKFGGFLVIEAEGAPRDALHEIQILLQLAEDNIRTATSARLAGQKDTVESIVTAIREECAEPLQRAGEVLDFRTVSSGDDETNAAVGPAQFPESLSGGVEVIGGSVVDTIDAHQAQAADAKNSGDDWVEKTQREATECIKRLQLRNGEQGWPYSRVFESGLFKGATRATLIDPYLAAPHQMRNLKDFLLHVADAVHPKFIEIVSNFNSPELDAIQQSQIDAVSADLFNSFGVMLTLRRELELHDRYLVLDNGVLFKLGRGLDIYKPATGLAAHRQEIRRVRQTDIDVFAVQSQPLVNTCSDRA